MEGLTRILFVEDDPDIRTIAQLALEAVGGYTVAVCESGDEALSVAPGFRPDLMLLDVMMPGMDGPTTLAALKRLPSLATTPVIFMTARVQRHEVEQYRVLGAIDIIPKPFDPLLLPETIAKIWSRSKV